jgi:Putative MetA-pathway of phenol degradation
MKGPAAISYPAAALLLVSNAEAVGADKNQYWLFNPTPDRLLREMTTDRPDITESPFTVDAGHVQFETTLVGYTRSAADQEHTVADEFDFATTNIRIGVTNSAEIDLVWQPYGTVRIRQADPLRIFHQSGIGGVGLRAKFNLWGNDTFEKPGSTALALLPFLILPTDRHNAISPEFVAGGIVVPLAVKLSDKWEVTLNGALAHLREDAESSYHTEYLASASFSYEWSEKFGTYYEIAGRFNTENSRGDPVVLGTGFTYKLTKDVQLDAGVNFGVTPAADRINPFLGLSVRF